MIESHVHPSQREEGCGHIAADELSPRNMVIKQRGKINKMLTSTKRDVIATPGQLMQFTNSMDLLGHIKSAMHGDNLMVAA